MNVQRYDKVQDSSSASNNVVYYNKEINWKSDWKTISHIFQEVDRQQQDAKRGHHFRVQYLPGAYNEKNFSIMSQEKHFVDQEYVGFADLIALMKTQLLDKQAPYQENIKQEVFDKFANFTHRFREKYKDKIDRVENAPKEGLEGLISRIKNFFSGATSIYEKYREATDLITQFYEAYPETKPIDKSTLDFRVPEAVNLKLNIKNNPHQVKGILKTSSAEDKTEVKEVKNVTFDPSMEKVPELKERIRE